MKKHISTIVIVSIFLVGLSVLLYPFVSDWVNARNQSRVIQSYFYDLERLSEQDFTDLFNAAHMYNERLATRADRFRLSPEDWEEYFSLLNPNNNSVMGVVEIDSINVRLPIYHTADETVLQIGAGHFEGSSLPVGGIGTHTVITAHRGLPSSTLFTNLDRLQIGETFVLRVLNKTLTYQVNQILTVYPDDVSALRIYADKDFCTLVTCTPYGINSHRLLVRGHRVENIEAEQGGIVLHQEAVRTNTIFFIILAPIAIILVTCLFLRYIKTKGRRNEK